MEKVADWELAHPDQAASPVAAPEAKNPLGWIVGTFYTGLTALADVSANPRYADAIFALGEQKNWSLGPRPFHADDYEVAQNWVWAYQRKHDPRMIAAVRERFDSIIAANVPDSLLMVPRSGSLGGCFRRWCWCDALFMGPTGWIALNQAVKDPRYLAYADKEFRATTALLFDPDQALYYRDSSYFGKAGPHGEKIFWSRGNGWVYAGLARILTTLPANSPSRPYYRDLFLKMSRKLVSLQKPDGSWAPSLLDPRKDTPPETSGTAFFTYGLAWGVHAGLLKEPVYRRAAERGWALVTKAVQPDGKLGWVQQVGSEPDSVGPDYTQPFGVGAFLLAGSAMIDLNR
jgi:rhamnogalacturonyl hydrolase YesR